MARPDLSAAPPPADLKPAAHAIDEVERLGIVYALWRWVGHTASLPQRKDWERDKDWPDPQLVDDLFGSWDKLVDEAGAQDARLVKLREQLDQEGERLTAHQRSVDKDAEKMPELRRQLEQAKRKRDEAQDEAGRSRGEVQRLREQLDAAAAQAALSANDAPAAAPVAAPEPDAALREERERHDTARVALGELQTRFDTLADEHDRARRTIAQLSAELARSSTAGPASSDPAPVATDVVPRTALEAVEIAAREAAALRFAPRAFESAADSPFTRPELMLRALRALDKLAVLYANPRGMGRSLQQAAAELGLTQWRGDVSEVTRGKHPEHYRFPYRGHDLPMGPHIGLGTGSGAGHIARIYLFIGDHPELGRLSVVGWAGRHLPDSTT